MRVAISKSKGVGKLLNRVDRFCGNLFYRKVSVFEIYQLEYHELKYWSSWHDVITKAENRTK